MREYIAKMDVAIEFKNYTEYVKTQLKFHYVYIEKCQNQVLIKNIEKLLYSPMPVTYSLKLPNDELFELFHQCNIDHKEMLQSFMDKDMKRLEELITRHWTNYSEETV
jgi:DNA-binding GntR family transcriptional regulator